MPEGPTEVNRFDFDPLRQLAAASSRMTCGWKPVASGVGRIFLSKNWYICFLVCSFSPSHLLYSTSSSAANASTLEVKCITPTCTLHNLLTQGIPDATIAMQHTPEEHQKNNGWEDVGWFGVAKI